MASSVDLPARNDNCFDKIEYINGARLSSLLINVGTDTLRNIFNKAVEGIVMTKGKKSYKSKLQQYLHQNESLVRSKLPFKKQQCQVVYPNNSCSACSAAEHAEEFDLTLLFALIRIMNLFDNDAGMQNKSDRLHNFRNTIYGHISTTGVKEEAYNKIQTSLSSLLIEMGADHSKIECCKTMLTSASAKEMEAKMHHLFISDLEDLNSLKRLLMVTVDQSKEKLDHTLIELKESIAENSNNWEEKTLLLFKELCRKTEEVRGLLQCLHDPRKEDELLKKIGKHLQNMQQQSEETNKCLKTLLTEVQKIPKADEIPSSCALECVQDSLKESSEKDCFKIIICTSLHESITKKCKELGAAIGLCPWNIVIDLNYKSLSEFGLYHTAMQNLRKFQRTETKTYAELDTITGDLKTSIAKGDTSLWILANGSETKDCNPCDTFRMVERKIDRLLELIILQLPFSTGLSCIFLMLNISNEDVEAVVNLSGKIKEICEIYSNKKILIEESYFYQLMADLGPGSWSQKSDLHFPKDLRDDKSFKPKATARQLITLFDYCYRNKDTLKYEFPGNEIKWRLGNEEVVLLKPYMEFYHINVGEFDYGKLGKHPDLNKEIQCRFLKGHSITPATFHVRNWLTTYITRQEMTGAKELATRELKKLRLATLLQADASEESSTEKGGYARILEIMHDPCGGGTTCGRYVLYSLREKYPCIEITKIDTLIFVGLKEIFDNAKKPLLLLVDNFDVDDVVSFRNCLANEWIKALILYVKRNTSPKSKVTWPQIELHATIHDETDKAGFVKLFNECEERQGQYKGDLIYLFGLYAFANKYEKLNSIVQQCTENMSADQKQIIRITYFVQCYSSRSIELSLLCQFLHIKTKNEFSQRLGNVRHILVVEEKEERDFVRLAHTRIADPLLARLTASCQVVNPEKAYSDVVKQFLNDLETIVRSNDIDEEKSFSLIKSLFIQKRREEQEHYTKFIKHLETMYSHEDVSQIIEAYIKLFHNFSFVAHLRLLHSRYLFHVMEKLEEAMTEIKTALNPNDPTKGVDYSSVTDSFLLSGYGDICRSMVYKISIKMDKSTNSENFESVIKKATNYLKEAVTAYEKAIASSNENFVPVWGVAEVCQILLQILFKHSFQSDHHKFHEYLKNTTVVWHRNLFQKASDAMDKTFLYADVWGSNLNSDREKAAKTNIRLLQLSAERNRKSTTEYVESFPLSIPLNVGGYVLDPTLSNINKPDVEKWDNLSEEHLELMIKAITARISNPDVMTRLNYDHIIIAMIYIRKKSCKSDILLYNVNSAVFYAQQWTRQYSDDFNAHFTLGYLTFIQGIDDENLVTIKASTASLAKCEQLCRKYPPMLAKRKLRIAIGLKNGLEKVVICKYELMNSTAADQHVKQLQLFSGVQLDEYHVAVRYAGSERAFSAVIARKGLKEFSIESGQNRLLSFNLAIARDRIAAINAKVVVDTVVKMF